MTTEIDAEGLAKALTEFIANVRQQDPDWEDDFDDGEITLVAPSGDYFAPELPLQAAITAYLATTRTSVAEPVAWQSAARLPVAVTILARHMDHELGDYVYQLIDCPKDSITPHTEWVTLDTLDRLTAPLPAPASDDQVEAAVTAGLEHYAEGGCIGLDSNERREVVREIVLAALAAMGSTKSVQAGDLDVGTPNHFDQNKRGFDPK